MTEQNKTLLAVGVARQTRKRNRVKFMAEMRTSFYADGELVENEHMKCEGKLVIPHSFHFNATTSHGDFSMYSHENEGYYVSGDDIEKIDSATQEKLLGSMQLDSIAKSNFERLMLYAEDMDVLTENNITTIFLPERSMHSDFFNEFSKDIELKDASLTLRSMKYRIQVDEKLNLLSYYLVFTIGLKNEEENFQGYMETKVDYFPLDENEDLSIPSHIVNNAK